MKKVVEIPTGFSNFFNYKGTYNTYYATSNQLFKNQLFKQTRYLYLPKVVRNLKVVSTSPNLEAIEGKTAVIIISKDKIDKRNARTDKPLPYKLIGAEHIWRMYIYLIQKRPDGTPAHSDYTIKVCYDAFAIPDDDPLLSQYSILKLYPVGWIAIGPRSISIPQRRIFKAVRELKKINDPIQLMKIERILNLDKIEL